MSWTAVVQLMSAISFWMVFGANQTLACAENPNLSNSVVSIEGEEWRGTAWFLSNRMLVTMEHVSKSLNLDKKWRKIKISNGENTKNTLARLVSVQGNLSEKISILEIMSRFPDSEPLHFRTSPLKVGESVVSLGFPHGDPRFTTGTFTGEDKGLVNFELVDGNDRLAIDHGSSGSPIVDCDSFVVGVVAGIFTHTFPFWNVRISTASGTPNVQAVPVH